LKIKIEWCVWKQYRQLCHLSGTELLKDLSLNYTSPCPCACPSESSLCPRPSPAKLNDRQVKHTVIGLKFARTIHDAPL